jgi:N6-L-threonylcarbamoyladenine synthase
MNILGIETSCDETAAAVVSSPLQVRSNVIASQIASHIPYGGVVPELAAREHVQALPSVLEAAVRDSGLGWDGVEAVAVTRGPGLSSSLLSGLSAAWGLSRRLGVPCFPVHHLEGHLLSFFLEREDAPERQPALVMLVTGGHTALIRVDRPGEYRLLGRSIDDAAGEALDKGARLLELPYPGGPEIEVLAQKGDPDAVPFPKGLPGSEEARRRGGEVPLSFSGLKTSLRYTLEKNPGLRREDVAASYQQAVMSTLAGAAAAGLATSEDFRSLACVGGVAKNADLKRRLEDVARSRELPLLTVPLAYCTDNAAMVANVPLLRTVPALVTPVGADPNLPLDGMVLR